MLNRYSLLFGSSLLVLSACSSEDGATPNTGGSTSIAGSTSAGANNSAAGNSGTGGNGGNAGSLATAGSGTLAGSSGSVAGSAGGGGAPPMPAKPTMVGSEWALTLGEVTLQVDPAKGGRITTFKLGTENLLTGPAVHETYWGSTLWVAPEATLWMQPPPVPIDSAAYTAAATDTSLTLTSMAYSSAELKVSATKVFSSDPKANALTVEYKLTNTGQAAQMMAPWEVTRVQARGLTFFPKGPSMRLSMNATMPTTETNNIV
jgi:hypothetical protein